MKLTESGFDFVVVVGFFVNFENTDGEMTAKLSNSLGGWWLQGETSPAHRPHWGPSQLSAWALPSVALGLA